jgi:pantoate--beta-alanine ligase
VGLPEVIAGIAELRARLNPVRNDQSSIGLVPTMGALHRGHEALLAAARLQNETVVASIFVNPLQFDRKDDLDRYPRMLGSDLRICENRGVDVVFVPSPDELYPAEQLAFADVPALGRYLCGQHRAGHFRGVTTVVLKFFNIVQPRRAYFGQKDAQQLAIIRRMVQDLNVPVEIVPVPTVREPDGLALSSRNKLLSPHERAIAPVLSRALQTAKDLLDRGEQSAQLIRESGMAVIAPYPEASIEYFEVTDPETLIPVEQIEGRVLIAGAMWLGATRLIDNVSWPENYGASASSASDSVVKTSDSPAVPQACA